MLTVAYPLFPGNLLTQEATDQEVTCGFDFGAGSGGTVETTIRNNTNPPPSFTIFLTSYR